MKETSTTPLYVFLGARGSGRREILLHLLLSELDGPASNSVVFRSREECPSPFDRDIEELQGVEVIPWKWSEDHTFDLDRPSSAATIAFFLTDGNIDPVDQIEALLPVLERGSFQLGRIITVVHCKLLESHQAVLPWYDACIHFSDVVLLNRRRSVANRWIQDFQKTYTKSCYPCLFAMVKQGKVENPAELLYPEPQRLSLVFEMKDFTEMDVEADAFDLEIEHDRSGGPMADDSDLLDQETDPLMERYANGRRVRQLPDIRAFPLPARS